MFSPSNMLLSNFVYNHFLCVLHVCRSEKQLSRDIASLVSGDQETAVVLYTVMKFDQTCRGCWMYFFYCTVVHTKFIYNYLVFELSSVFHLLPDYFTVVQWKYVPNCSLLNYYYYVIYFLHTVIDIELQKYSWILISFLLSVIDLMSVHWAEKSSVCLNCKHWRIPVTRLKSVKD